jgi:crotonobetainyl-CoA:carnitine CoA-transferase CaiB-like acyl-CoA transferase
MGAPTLQPYLATGNDFYSKQISRTQAPNPLWNRYPTQDKWMFICQENTDDGFSRVCECVEATELTADSRFESASLREENNAALIEQLDSRLAQRSAQEWSQRFSDAGIDASPIQSFKELAEDPQAWENDYFLKTHCSEVDREVEIRGLPITLSKTPGRVESLGPELGQDTEIILMELLGMEWEQIEELKAQEVIP